MKYFSDDDDLVVFFSTVSTSYWLTECGAPDFLC